MLTQQERDAIRKDTGAGYDYDDEGKLFAIVEYNDQRPRLPILIGVTVCLALALIIWLIA